MLNKGWKRENNVSQARKHFLQKKYRRSGLFSFRIKFYPSSYRLLRERVPSSAQGYYSRRPGI